MLKRKICNLLTRRRLTKNLLHEVGEVDEFCHRELLGAFVEDLFVHRTALHEGFERVAHSLTALVERCFDYGDEEFFVATEALF